MSGADDFPELRAHLLAHSVRRGDFVLKSGRRSSWFIDSKQTVCRPEAMLLVADAVLSVTPPEATAIGGLTMGADPVAFVTAGVAATRGRLLKAFSVRKEVKDHGGGGRIAGALDAGRQGGGDRGHGNPGHVVARGGPGHSRSRGGSGPAGGRRRSRGHRAKPWPRPRDSPSGPSSRRPISASTTKAPEPWRHTNSSHKAHGLLMIALHPLGSGPKGESNHVEDRCQNPKRTLQAHRPGHRRVGRRRRRDGLRRRRHVRGRKIRCTPQPPDLDDNPYVFASRNIPAAAACD